jgi:hypothetical protein
MPIGLIMAASGIASGLTIHEHVKKHFKRRKKGRSGMTCECTPRRPGRAGTSKATPLIAHLRKIESVLNKYEKDLEKAERSDMRSIQSKVYEKLHTLQLQGERLLPTEEDKILAENAMKRVWPFVETMKQEASDLRSKQTLADIRRREDEAVENDKRSGLYRYKQELKLMGR